jgi:CRISPR/Cas system endoribonuclease Cas6 (RAMP superfamily)
VLQAYQRVIARCDIKIQGWRLLSVRVRKSGRDNAPALVSLGVLGGSNRSRSFALSFLAANLLRL